MSDHDGRTPPAPLGFGFGFMPNIHPVAGGEGAAHQPTQPGRPAEGSDASAAPASAGAPAPREEVGQQQVRMRALVAEAYANTKQAAAALVSGGDATGSINRVGRLLEELSATLGR